jgi:hypothetical protein
MPATTMLIDGTYKPATCKRCGARMMRNYPDLERTCVLCGFSDYESLASRLSPDQMRRLLEGIENVPACLRTSDTA